MKKYTIRIIQDKRKIDDRVQSIDLKNRSKSETMKFISCIYDLIEEPNHYFFILDEENNEIKTAKDFLLEI